MKILHNSTEFLPYVIFVGQPLPAMPPVPVSGEASAVATPRREMSYGRHLEDGVAVFETSRDREVAGAESDTNSERTVVVVVPDNNGGVTITTNGHTGDAPMKLGFIFEHF